MPPVGRPTGPLVPPRVPRELDNLPGGYVHDVDVVIAVAPSRTEGQQLSVGRPRWINDVGHVRQRQLLHVRAVGVHQVKLRQSSTIAHEGYLLAGLRVPRRRGIHPGRMGDALEPAAVRVGGEEFRVAQHAGHEHDLRAVGRPGRRAVRAAPGPEGHGLASLHRVHADLRASPPAQGGVAGERDAGGVRRPPRRQSDRVQRSQLTLVGAVVVHHPDLLAAAARADKRDLRAGHAGYTARKAHDDLVRKLVSEAAELRVADLAAIALAEHLWRARVAHVVQPRFDGQVIAAGTQVAEREQVRRRGRIVPRLVLELRGHARRLERIEALADQLENAAVVEVGAQNLAEQIRQRLRRIASGCEVRHGHPRLFHPEARAGAEPVLRGQRRGQSQTAEQHRGTEMTEIPGRRGSRRPRKLARSHLYRHPIYSTPCRNEIPWAEVQREPPGIPIGISASGGIQSKTRR